MKFVSYYYYSFQCSLGFWPNFGPNRIINNNQQLIPNEKISPKTQFNVQQQYNLHNFWHLRFTIISNNFVYLFFYHKSITLYSSKWSRFKFNVCIVQCVFQSATMILNCRFVGLAAVCKADIHLACVDCRLSIVGAIEKLKLCVFLFPSVAISIWKSHTKLIFLRFNGNRSITVRISKYTPEHCNMDLMKLTNSHRDFVLCARFSLFHWLKYTHFNGLFTGHIECHAIENEKKEIFRAFEF